MQDILSSANVVQSTENYEISKIVKKQTALIYITFTSKTR